MDIYFKTTPHLYTRINVLNCIKFKKHLCVLFIISITNNWFKNRNLQNVNMDGEIKCHIGENNSKTSIYDTSPLKLISVVNTHYQLYFFFMFY
jgi:hypothetical protein